MSATTTTAEVQIVTINPADYTVPTDVGQRGRTEPSEASILQLAHSMVKFGQLQPIGIDGETLQPIFGWTRIQAGQLIRKGYQFDGKKWQREDFQLQAQVFSPGTEKSQAEKRAIENMSRNELSPIAKALVARDLCESHGYKPVQVQKLLGWDKSKYSRIMSLLQLPDAIQTYVDKGQLAMSVAVELGKPSNELSEQEQLDLVEAHGVAENGDGGLTIAIIQDHVRNRNEELKKQLEAEKAAESGAETASEPAGSAEPKPGAVGRTKAAIVAFCESYANQDANEEGYDPTVAMLMKCVLTYAHGGHEPSIHGQITKLRNQLALLNDK